MIIFVVIVNAFVTGVFASVEDRYQSRVIWLLPLLAILFALAWLDHHGSMQPWLTRIPFVAAIRHKIGRNRQVLLLEDILLLGKFAVRPWTRYSQPGLAGRTQDSKIPLS